MKAGKSMKLGGEVDYRTKRAVGDYRKDMDGRRFGSLLVLGDCAPEAGKRRRLVCMCDCGRYTVGLYADLVANKKLSCGCRNKIDWITSYEMDIDKPTYTRLYRIYGLMIYRCHKTKEGTKMYKDYRTRGITVCDEWVGSFISFLRWAINNGYSSNLEIDRINNNGNYEPNNCRWVTRKENNRNTRNCKMITHNNITKSISSWAEEMGVHKDMLYGRARRGWSNEDILTIPIPKK